jgi:hypothetical protein
VEHWLFTLLTREGAASTLSRLGELAERAHGTPGWVSTLLGPEEAAASQGFFARPAGVNLRMKVHAAWFRP